MSFTGNLEHLPIVDVIQLLHSARKSGILRVMCRKGESQLVFKEGYIVSANHLNGSICIGKLLVEMKIITAEILDQALLAQKQAGTHRKPLIITLVEKGQAKEADLYKGLEQLIEITIVEILTWKKGTFTLDIGAPAVADEYGYYPQKMDSEINVDTQSVLMDALRLYDEKVRDGLLAEEDEPAEGENDGPLLSAEDLGLADLDQVERKVPEVLTVLEESDPCRVHRLLLAEIAPGVCASGQEELVAYLAKCSAGGEMSRDQLESGQPLVFFTDDRLLIHTVTTVCHPVGISVFATSHDDELQQIVGRCLSSNSLPLVIFDAPQKCGPGYSPERLTTLRQQQVNNYPDITSIQLASPEDAAFALQAYEDGVRAVIPRPLSEEREKHFAADTIHFLDALQRYIRKCTEDKRNSSLARLKNGILRLHELNEASEAARVLLEEVGSIFQRSLTLIVREKELVAGKGMGVTGEKSQGISRPLGFRIPLVKPSLLSGLIEGGSLHYGMTEDEAIREHLFSAIGAPYSPVILLLPMRCRGKTLSLTYGDFGCSGPSPVATDLLEILARQAELVLENSLQRKKLGKAQ